ncbi:MAG: RHS repeat-associated core domain-containing protein [Myxococcales bacterium]
MAGAWGGHRQLQPNLLPRLADGGVYGWKGMSIESIDYGEYQAGATPVALPLRFPGQYYDPETDPHENWNRFYDPNLDRYLSPEPLWQNPKAALWAAKTGKILPMYAYAGNNPLHWTDSSGLAFGGGPLPSWVTPDTVMDLLPLVPALLEALGALDTGGPEAAEAQAESAIADAEAAAAEQDAAAGGGGGRSGRWGRLCRNSARPVLWPIGVTEGRQPNGPKRVDHGPNPGRDRQRGPSPSRQ